jgi:hypothetical protein
MPLIVVHTSQPSADTTTAVGSYPMQGPTQEGAAGMPGSGSPSLLDIQQDAQRRMTSQSEQEFPQLLVLDGSNLV